jgi:hypothetical protein
MRLVSDKLFLVPCKHYNFHFHVFSVDFEVISLLVPQAFKDFMFQTAAKQNKHRVIDAFKKCYQPTANLMRNYNAEMLGDPRFILSRSDNFCLK